MRRMTWALAAVAVGLLLAVAVRDRTGEARAWTVQPAPLPPIAPATGGPLDGVMVGRLSNHTVGNGEAFPFDHQISGWPTEDPAVLVVPVDGWYLVGADITTLGTGYGGPPNDDVVLSVVRNWDHDGPHLTATVAVERFRNDPAGDAVTINSLLQPVWLEAGDRLELVLVGPTDEGLLVESNPSDGLPDGFPTDEGPGTLSPRFYLLPL